MNRDEKTAVVEDLAGHLSEAQAVFAVDYKGISVTQAAELRTKLRESDASFKVVKNRLAKLAAAKAGTGELDELLTGPIALTLINGDAVVVAKTITTFTKEHNVLQFKGGIMDGAALDVESFDAIAKLPGLDVLYGQLVGLTASPLTGLVAGMSNLISGLGRQLAQIAEQGLVSGDARVPEAEAPEPEPPVEEPAPADEPAPEEAPVEEPPTEEPAPRPEAESESESAGASDEVAEEAAEPASPPEPGPDGNEGGTEASGGSIETDETDEDSQED